MPANDRADAPFDLVVSWRARLEMRRNRVDVGGVGGERYERAVASRFFDQPFEQVVRALGTFAIEHRVECFEPLLAFLRIEVRSLFDVAGIHYPRSSRIQCRKSRRL